MPHDARARSALLAPTLRHALRAPWYRRAWGGRWRRGLTALPFLTKPLAVAHQADLLASEVGPWVGTVSSGTQHGDRRPLRVPETANERAAFRAFADLEDAGAEAAGSARTLEVLSMQHGFPEAPPPPGVERIGWAFEEQTLRRIAAVLGRRGPRRVEALVIGAGALVPLTAWLWERGQDPSAFGVRDVATTGFRLGPHWRARVEALWRARLHDSFSLSEFANSAPQCEACGFHHWLWPSLYTEVVHPLSRRPVDAGAGVLVLTTLWPFVQALPLVRYWTGDLVEWGPRCPSRREPGFRFLGRAAACALEPREGALLVSPHDVEAFLEQRPDVARVPHPLQRLGVLASPDVGVPKFELEAGRRRGRLEVVVRAEVRYEPAVFPAAARSLEASLAAALRRARPALARSLRAGRAGLRVEVARPGALTRKWTKF